MAQALPAVPELHAAQEQLGEQAHSAGSRLAGDSSAAADNLARRAAALPAQDGMSSQGPSARRSAAMEIQNHSWVQARFALADTYYGSARTPDA